MVLNCFSVSATNCVRLYEIAQARVSVEHRNKPWQFLSSLTTEEVWDAFVILALLDNHQRRGMQLCVPHVGDQKNRFTAAMRARTEHIMTHGQDELPHACYGCMRVFTSPDGTLRGTEVIVTDGVTVGHPCCAVARCKSPLVSNRHRYCSEHKMLETVCAVDGCGRPVTKDHNTGKPRKACDDPMHVKMETANTESLRSGKSRTQRKKIAKPTDTIEPEDIAMLPVQDVDEWYELDVPTGAVRLVQESVTTSTGVSDVPSAPAPEPSCMGKDAPVKVKATFRRQRTNNEQLIVRPCGVISGRGTMYHHEAVSNVLVGFFISSNSDLHDLNVLSRFLSRRYSRYPVLANLST